MGWQEVVAMRLVRAVGLSLALAGACASAGALDLVRAERVFAQHCAVCHGADRGGYIGPALNRDETRLSRGQIAGKILSGAPPTLMPQHPSWRTGLSGKDQALLVELIATQPKTRPGWGMEDVRRSLQVLVADEATLPAAPRYRIARIDDLMGVMSRARQGAGKQAKVLFYDGHTHRKVGEVATGPTSMPSASPSRIERSPAANVNPCRSLVCPCVISGSSISIGSSSVTTDSSAVLRSCTSE